MKRKFNLDLSAKLIPCEEGGFSISCPEIPGAISQGETEEEAVENLKNAVTELLKLKAAFGIENGIKSLFDAAIEKSKEDLEIFEVYKIWKDLYSEYLKIDSLLQDLIIRTESKKEFFNCGFEDGN